MRKKKDYGVDGLHTLKSKWRRRQQLETSVAENPQRTLATGEVITIDSIRPIDMEQWLKTTKSIAHFSQAH